MPVVPPLVAEQTLGAALSPPGALAVAEPARRKRLQPGERRTQILQALAAMLEQPGAERITTAALAARLDVSEAALYRHFASKAQMFEGLIGFIEDSVLAVAAGLAARESDPATRSRKLVKAVLRFAEKNPGMARVMAGDALVLEHERLQARMNQLLERLEAGFTHNLSLDTADAVSAPVRAAVLVDFIVGRLQRFVRSGFKSVPSRHLDASLTMLLA